MKPSPSLKFITPFPKANSFHGKIHWNLNISTQCIAIIDPLPTPFEKSALKPKSCWRWQTTYKGEILSYVERLNDTLPQLLKLNFGNAYLNRWESDLNLPLLAHSNHHHLRQEVKSLNDRQCSMLKPIDSYVASNVRVPITLNGTVIYTYAKNADKEHQAIHKEIAQADTSLTTTPGDTLI